MQRFYVDRFFNGAARFRTEYPGSPFQKLAAPLRDLVGMNIKQLRQIGQRLFTLHRRQRYLCLEGRAVIP